jgi:hypothetical protein
MKFCKFLEQTSNEFLDYALPMNVRTAIKKVRWKDLSNWWCG